MRAIFVGTTAIALALGMSAAAAQGQADQQQDTVQQQEQPTQDQQFLGQTEQQAAPAEGGTGISAEELIGQDVMSSDGEEVGEIKDIVLDPVTQVEQIIIGMGGFLGIGERELAVDASRLQQQGDTLIIDMTLSEASLAEREGREARQAAGDAEQEPGEQQAEVAPADQARQEMEQAGEAIERESEQAGQAIEQEAEQAERQIEQEMQQAEQQMQQPDQPAQLPMTAEELMDKQIYSAQGEEIGQVQDVVLDESGEIKAIVVGVGGFLGMGEHNVAIDMAEVQQQDGRWSVNMTQQQLSELPEFEEEQLRQGQQPQQTPPTEQPPAGNQ